MTINKAEISNQDNVKSRRAATTLDVTQNCHSSVVLQPRLNKLPTTNVTKIYSL